MLDFQIYLISPVLRALPAASPTAAPHGRATPPRATASSTVTPTALPPQPRPLPHPPAVPTVAPRRQGHRGRQAALAAAVNQDGHTSAPHRGGVARDTSAAVSDRARRRSSAVPTVAPPPPRASRTPSGAGCGGDQDGHTSAPSRGGVARDTTPAVSDGAQLRISGEGLSGATPSKGATRGWRRLLSLTAATTAATDC